MSIARWTHGLRIGYILMYLNKSRTTRVRAIITWNAIKKPLLMLITATSMQPESMKRPSKTYPKYHALLPKNLLCDLIFNAMHPLVNGALRAWDGEYDTLNASSTVPIRVQLGENVLREARDAIWMLVRTGKAQSEGETRR